MFMDKVKKVFDAFWMAMIVAFAIWVVWLVISHIPQVIGLTIVLEIPWWLAFAVSPLVLGPILWIVLLIAQMIYNYVVPKAP